MHTHTHIQGALVFPDMDALEALLAQRNSSSESSSSSGSSSSTASHNGTPATHPLASKASQQELEQVYMAEIGRLEEAG